MPYIQGYRREELEAFAQPTTTGELNYVLTRIISQYLEREGLCYDTINDILGAIEGCKAEFYRRVAAPYEDRAIERNGDVYL